MKSTSSACEHLRFREVADARLGHHRNAHRVHDLPNDARRGHARDAAFLADVGRDALERHHGAGAGLLGDARLLGGGHVHDHAALEHLGEAHLHPPLIVGISVARFHYWLLAPLSARDFPALSAPA